MRSLDASRRAQFLRSTSVVDFDAPVVRARAVALRGAATIETARRSFEWVRDEVRHAVDHHLDPVTCMASEVLTARGGFCYAKSHLLAALLRANGIPAGFVYQRLLLDPAAGTFCLHGLNAIWLDEYGWYRVDARGNKPGVDARFDPPREQLAFAVTAPGEQLFSGIYADPLPSVVDALTRHRHRSSLEAHLPDAEALEAALPA